MTTIELIQELLDTIMRDPHKANVQVYAFMADEETTANRSDNFESPIPITSVDYDISDRVDINI